MLGMTLSTFTLFHVVLSLVGIASGFIVVYGLLAGKPAEATPRSIVGKVA
jgi:hypothetical protein